EDSHQVRTLGLGLLPNHGVHGSRIVRWEQSRRNQLIAYIICGLVSFHSGRPIVGKSGGDFDFGADHCSDGSVCSGRSRHGAGATATVCGDHYCRVVAWGGSRLLARAEVRETSTINSAPTRVKEGTKPQRKAFV